MLITIDSTRQTHDLYFHHESLKISFYESNCQRNQFHYVILGGKYNLARKNRSGLGSGSKREMENVKESERENKMLAKPDIVLVQRDICRSSFGP